MTNEKNGTEKTDKEMFEAETVQEWSDLSYHENDIQKVVEAYMVVKNAGGLKEILKNITQQEKMGFSDKEIDMCDITTQGSEKIEITFRLPTRRKIEIPLQRKSIVDMNANEYDEYTLLWKEFREYQQRRIEEINGWKKEKHEKEEAEKKQRYLDSLPEIVEKQKRRIDELEKQIHSRDTEILQKYFESGDVITIDESTEKTLKVVSDDEDC